MQWEKVFNSCFIEVDDEVSGKVSRVIPVEDASVSNCASEPVAPETVGSTAVVAVVCSSHIIVANCGDSRAVLYRGKEPIALSVDHKVSLYVFLALCRFLGQVLLAALDLFVAISLFSQIGRMNMLESRRLVAR